MRSSFFAKENLIHPHIFTVIFTLYPFYSIIEQNIAYTQNFIAKCKKVSRSLNEFQKLKTIIRTLRLS